MHMFNVDYVMSLDIRKQPRDTISKFKAIHMQHLPELSCVLWFLPCGKKTSHEMYSPNKFSSQYHIVVPYLSRTYSF